MKTAQEILKEAIDAHSQHDGEYTSYKHLEVEYKRVLLEAMEEYAQQFKENQPVISEADIILKASDKYKNWFDEYHEGEKKLAFINGAKWVLSLSSNDKQEKKPLSEITDEHAIEACKLLFRHPNPEYDITPDEVAVAPFTRGEEYFKLEVVCRCFEGTVMICFNGDIQCFDEEGKLQSINPLTYYQYLQFKGYKLPIYYPEKKGGEE